MIWCKLSLLFQDRWTFSFWNRLFVRQFIYLFCFKKRTVESTNFSVTTKNAFRSNITVIPLLTVMMNQTNGAVVIGQFQKSYPSLYIFFLNPNLPFIWSKSILVCFKFRLIWYKLRYWSIEFLKQFYASSKSLNLSLLLPKRSELP